MDRYLKYIKIKNKVEDWKNAPHKKIYHALKDIKTHYVEQKIIEAESILWKEIVLRSKETKKLFNNRDKEITTRIAHQGHK